VEDGAKVFGPLADGSPEEQLSEGIEVTGDSMHEIHEVEKGENMAEENTNTRISKFAVNRRAKSHSYVVTA